MIKSILVATDGSAMAMKAAEYAVGAKQTGAGLIAVSVIDQGLFVTQSISGEATPTHLIEPVEDYLRQVAAGYLESIKRMCRDQKIKVRTVTRSGYPIEIFIWVVGWGDGNLNTGKTWEKRQTRLHPLPRLDIEIAQFKMEWISI